MSLQANLWPNRQGCSCFDSWNDACCKRWSYQFNFHGRPNLWQSWRQPILKLAASPGRVLRTREPILVSTGGPSDPIHRRIWPYSSPGLWCSMFRFFFQHEFSYSQFDFALDESFYAQSPVSFWIGFLASWSASWEWSCYKQQQPYLGFITLLLWWCAIGDTWCSLA